MFIIGRVTLALVLNLLPKPLVLGAFQKDHIVPNMREVVCIELWYHTQPTSVALIRVCRYDKSKRFKIWIRHGYGDNKLVDVYLELMFWDLKDYND